MLPVVQMLVNHKQGRNFSSILASFEAIYRFPIAEAYLYSYGVRPCKIKGDHDRMVVGFTTTKAISAYDL